MKKEGSKEIRDYLHLYLGCDAIIESIENKFMERAVESGLYGEVGQTIKVDRFRLSLLKDGDSGVYQLKPILRPLSSMTEEEWKKCFELAQGTFDQSISDKVQKMSSTEIIVTLGKAQFVFGYHNCFENDVRIGSGLCFFMKRYLIKEVLQVSDGGLEATDSQFNDLVIEPVENINHIFFYLLSKHFDIFHLIESGLAIDATTLNTSSPHQSKTSK